MEKSQASDSMKEKKKILVSVIMPVFNAEKFVGEAVESILSQSFGEFELIVIDDGSTDSSLSILKSFEINDPRLRLISRENRGLIATLNEGIFEAQGEWIARMDADDISLTNRLEKQLLWLEKTGADIAGTWVKFFGSMDRRIWKGYQTDESIKAEMLFKCPFVHPSVMMRAELAKQLKYDLVADKSEDYDLWVRAALEGWKMTNVPEVLLYYRKHHNQVSVTSANLQLANSELARKKYWNNYASLMDIESIMQNDAFKATSPISSQFDLKASKIVLQKLLSSHYGAPRKIILENIYRSFLRVTTDQRDVFKVWVQINNEFGSGSLDKTVISLWLMQYFPSYISRAAYSGFRKIRHFVKR